MNKVDNLLAQVITRKAFGALVICCSTLLAISIACMIMHILGVANLIYIASIMIDITLVVLVMMLIIIFIAIIAQHWPSKKG